MSVGTVNRKIVDHSFKLGYIFCVTISDLRLIINALVSNDISKAISILNLEFLNRFDSIDQHFQKLRLYDSITEDDLQHIRAFVSESKEMLNETIIELQNTGKITQEKRERINKLLADMLDY